MLAAAEHTLHVPLGPIDRDHRTRRTQRCQPDSQVSLALHGHQHAAQLLAESIDQEIHGHAPLLRREQRGEKLDAVGVVLDVERRQVEKRRRLPNHAKTTRPFGRAVP